MKHRLLFLLSGLAAFLCLGTAQAQTYFNERYPSLTGGQSGFTTITPTPTGYLACGVIYPTPTGPGGLPLTLNFLDFQGQLVRQRTYARLDYAYYPGMGESLLPLPDGGYVLCGSTVLNVLPWGQNISTLWRFNAAGDTLWTRNFPLTEQNICYAGCRTRDGGFAMVGVIVPPTTGRSLLVIRTDSAGTLLWQRTYRLQALNTGYSIAEMPDGGFVLGGVTSDRAFVDQGTFVVRTDSAGTMLWQQRLGPRNLTNGIGIVRATRDGGYAVLAAVAQPPNGTLDVLRNCIYKFDHNNQLLWQRLIGPQTYSAYCPVLLELADGSLVGIGQERGPITASVPVQAAVFKVCADGDSVWYRTHKLLPNSDNYPRGFAATPDGGFVAAGFLLVFAPDTGTADAWTFKIDSAGYGQPGGLAPTVTCRPLSIGAASGAEQMAVEVWPNPSADGHYSVRAAGAIELHVRDALGREVWRGPAAAGEAPTLLDLSRQAAGIYHLRLTWPDGRSVTKKLVGASDNP